jgi:hypothetical protein
MDLLRKMRLPHWHSEQEVLSSQTYHAFEALDLSIRHSRLNGRHDDSEATFALSRVA